MSNLCEISKREFSHDLTETEHDIEIDRLGSSLVCPTACST